MSTLVFHSIDELKEYLRTAPEDEFIRITVMAEDDNKENGDGREEGSKEQ